MLLVPYRYAMCAKYARVATAATSCHVFFVASKFSVLCARTTRALSIPLTVWRGGNIIGVAMGAFMKPRIYGFDPGDPSFLIWFV